MKRTIEQRLHQGSKMMPNDCWEWQKSVRDNGRGQMCVDYEYVYPHRVSYTLYVGPIGDASVSQVCKNPLCLNPEHLFLKGKKTGRSEETGKNIGHRRLKKLTPAQLAERQANIFRNIKVENEQTESRPNFRHTLQLEESRAEHKRLRIRSKIRQAA